MLGFKVVIVTGALIGLIGGILFGVWDSVTVLIDYGTFPVALREIFFLALYSVALYTVVGCLGMAAIGAITGGVIKIGGYRANKAQLAGVLVGVAALMAVFALLAYDIMFGNIVDIVEVTVICILSGVGLAGLIVYVLNQGFRKERLIAASISLFVWLLVLIYGGLWINFGFLAYSRPMSLLANVALLIFASLLAVGLYITVLLIFKGYSARRREQAGYASLAIILCASIIISFIGPFG